MSGFEALSTEALKDNAEREKVAKEAASRPSSKPMFNPKTIADAHKHAAKIKEDAERKKSQPRVIQKIVKLEKYYSTFGPVLKNKKPKYHPDSVTEKELDVYIETVERELNSRNSERITETVYLIGIKGIEMLADLFVDKQDLDLSSSVKLSDVAATDVWKSRVSENLEYLRIKYSLFETSPELSMVIHVASMVKEVHSINRARSAMRMPDAKPSDVIPERYEKL
jgi:hypothetical protein